MAIFVFDAYGTLFDVHAAIARFRGRSRAGRRPHVGNLAHQAARIHLDADARRALHGFLDADRARAGFRAGARAVGDRRRSSRKLLDAYFKLDAFPDARAALRTLKAKGHKTGILSNGSPNMLKGAVDGAGIGGDLDAVLSVDVLKMFKPRPEVYAPRHRSFQMQAGRRDFRVVQPLGRDGGHLGRLPRPVGQPRARCRTNISISRRCKR